MDLDIFVDQDKAENFLCQICLLVVKDPIVEHFDCHKSFCQPCFRRIPNSKCPNCRGSTIRRMGPMNPILRDEVYSQLEMRCMNDPQCQETFTVAQSAAHNARCPYRMIACKLCRQSMKWVQLEPHSSKLCPFYPIKCPVPGCGVTTVRCQVFKHNQEYVNHHNLLLLKRIESLEEENALLKQQNAQLLLKSKTDDQEQQNSTRVPEYSNPNKLKGQTLTLETLFRRLEEFHSHHGDSPSTRWQL